MKTARLLLALVLLPTAPMALADAAPAAVPQSYLKAWNPGQDDQFGRSVAVSGDTLIVGAYEEDSDATGVDGIGNSNGAPNSGAAYIFVRQGSNWVQQAYLKASDTGAGHEFGISVAISGDIAVVGARQQQNDASGSSGAAYVFVRSGGVWTQRAILKASNRRAQHWFGQSVAISGGTIVVGAPYESSDAVGIDGDGNNENAPVSGAAYVFGFDGADWVEQAFLKASNAQESDIFGFSVAIDGDTIVVGAIGEAGGFGGVDGDESDNSRQSSGAAYAFVRDGGGAWSQQAYLKASDPQPDDIFGYSVAVSGDTAVAGVPWEDTATTDNSGAAYVFARNGGTWSPQARLAASNAETEDQFGQSVAASGTRVLVGAPYEDGNGRDGEDDNSESSAGAAYLFEPDGGGGWSQTVYLKAGNAKGGDSFGTSVSLSGGIALMGAPDEDGDGSGPDDNSTPNSGAAYAFLLDPPASPAPPHLTVTRPRAFPATPVGRRSRPQAIRVGNLGGTAATGLAVRTSGKAGRDFRLTRPARNLAPGAETRFRATFRPRATGARRALATVRASNTPARSVPLRGRGR